MSKPAPRRDYAKLAFVAGIFIGILPTAVVQTYDARRAGETMQQVRDVALKACLGSRVSLLERASEVDVHARDEHSVARLFRARRDLAMSAAVDKRGADDTLAANGDRRNANLLTCEVDAHGGGAVRP